MVATDASPAADPGPCGAIPARTAGPATKDRPSAGPRPGRTIRSWPLLILAAPAAAEEVWSGWVGIAQKTGFGLVSPCRASGPARVWRKVSAECRRLDPVRLNSAGIVLGRHSLVQIPDAQSPNPRRN